MLAHRFVHLRVGCSVAAFLRNFQTGEAALEAWKLHYVQLTPLLNEIEGFSPFMLVMFNNLQRDSKYGLVFRVAVGALLSTIDATTDLYTLYTYWTSGFRGERAKRASLEQDSSNGNSRNSCRRPDPLLN